MTDAQPPLHGVAFTDVAEDLGHQLGELMAWLQPAQSSMLDYDGAVARNRAIRRVAAEFIDRYSGGEPLLTLSSDCAASESDRHLALALIFKAVELRAADADSNL